MSNLKKQLNERVEEIFKLRCPSAEFIGHIIDLDEAIYYILKLYRSLGGKLKKKIFFKISVDGREINKVKQVAVALVPLNLRDVFPSQAVSSVFYIGLFQMSETKESIKETIGTLTDEIKTVSQKTYFEKSEVHLFYVSDMHNVGFTFEFDICPYCMAKTVEEFGANNRTTLGGSLPFSPKDLIMCALHVKQRLVENTIAYMASSGQYNNTILQNLQKLKGLEHFNWRELKQRVTEYGISQTSERVTAKSSMLSGDQCNTILSNVEVIVNDIEQHTKEKYLNILKLLRNIIIIVEAKQDDPNTKQILTPDRIFKLDKMIMEFLCACYRIWSKGIKAHYFHFLTHLPSMMTELLDDDLSLSILSNQGFERSHLFHHAVFNRVINNGGGRHKIHVTKQLLLWQWRKVLTAIDIGEKFGSTYWNEKRLKQIYSWNSIHLKEAPQELHDLYYDLDESNVDLATLQQTISTSFQEQEQQSQNTEKQSEKTTTKRKQAKNTRQSDQATSFSGTMSTQVSQKKRKF
ncbi:hypothetical protein C9374_011785 [Naegleria lovaniensis]|nr:uncharacterized protein C9374_011785 [Naegleria lovaniensis]KAG2373900.1 hypothetical protein C9374_011785 [Naegleria lovaniensis]